jgi:plastocyanin
MNDGTFLSFTDVRPTLRINKVGNYTATLTVTDWWGNRGSDTTMITVEPVPPPPDEEPPVADAGPDIVVGMGEVFRLDGSSSRDNVGIARADWSIEVMGHLLEGTEMVWALSIESPGTYTAVLTVMDPSGNTDDDEVVITVVDREPPVAVAGDDVQVDMGTTVTFDGTDSKDNVAVTRYTWFIQVGDGELQWDGTTFTYTFEFPGTYEARLVVRDRAGNMAEDVVQVMVIDTMAPLADAGEDIVVDQGETFTLDGGESTDNVGITRWTWSYDIGEGTMTVGHPVMDVSVLEVGTYQFVLRVEDAEGNWGEDLVTVRVRATWV